ncbi:Leucine rich repeat-containing protein [Ruminococcus sp. YE71]|nr:Leucine rich repeat-containing protein [Ruminococcus sp. YE78]SFW31600.1 Leucine rich repeat-containing protein [Ruminococcus sp. YE71]
MIGDYSFYNCKNLTSVVIPSTVEFIGYEAFTYCSSVTDVYCYPNASDLFWAEGHCDDFAPNKATVCHVNADQLEAYRKKYGNDVNVSFTDNPGAVSVPDGDDFAMAIPVDMTYDGEPKIIDVVEKSEGLGRSTVKYYADKEREKEIECPADAGTYYIAVDVEDGDAFTAAEKVFGEFWSYTILKAAAPDLSELTDDQKAHAVEGLVYNGDYQDLITPPESLPEGYTKVLYSLDGQHLGEWDFYGRKAGTYTVNVKYIGDNNHRDFYGEDKTVTIAEEAYSAPGITYEKGEGSVQLNWTAVEGAEKYGIVGFVDGEWKLLARSNDTTYRLGKLKAGEEYNIADAEDMPIHEDNDHDHWDKFKLASGKQISLFPFTQNAIINLYDAMSDHKTPRYILRDIVEPAVNEALYDVSLFPQFCLGWRSALPESVENRIGNIVQSKRPRHNTCG